MALWNSLRNGPLFQQRFDLEAHLLSTFTSNKMRCKKRGESTFELLSRLHQCFAFYVDISWLLFSCKGAWIRYSKYRTQTSTSQWELDAIWYEYFIFCRSLGAQVHPNFVCAHILFIWKHSVLMDIFFNMWETNNKWGII